MKKYMVISAVLLILFYSTTSDAFEPLFDAAIIYRVGYSTSDLAIVDFNDDGHLDLAVANYGSNSLTLFTGNGEGELENNSWFPQTLETGSGPVAFTTLNFDNYEYVDLAVVNEISEDVYLYYGDVMGRMTYWGLFTTGDTPSDITAADFNGDGKDDIAVSNSGSDDLTVLIYGSGATNYPVGNNPQSVTTGDFNEDGNIDIAVANYDSDNISILFGIGDGNFSDAIFHTVEQNPSNLVPADFNKDGHTDLAVAGGKLSIMFGAGDGTFDSDVLYNGWVYSVAVGDFNYDGKTDLSVNINGIIIFLGAGDGTFSMVERPYLKGGLIEFGDFNEDGYVDLATDMGNLTGKDAVAIYRGIGDIDFLSGNKYQFGVSSTSVAAGDFDEDGNIDMVFGDPISCKLPILLGESDGGFSYTEYVIDENPEFVISEDFNNDGHADIAFTSPGKSYLYTLYGLGDGTFGTILAYDVGDNPCSIIAGYLNEDQWADLIVVNGGSNNLSVLIGTDEDSFLPAVNYHVGEYPLEVVTADFNEDGFVDLATVNQYSDNVSILFGIGDGTFPSADVLDTIGDRPSSLSTGDFNEDGHTDLAIVYYSYNHVTVFRGLGNGAFEFIESLESEEYSTAIKTNDYNGDGHKDLVVANGAFADISLILGNGDGTFLKTYNYSVGEGPHSISNVDFNYDGKTDIAIPSSTIYNSGVTILLNISEGGTATMLSSYLCSPANDGIEISWTLSEGDEDISFGVFRQTDGSDTFLPIDAEITGTGGLSYKAIDSSCLPGSVCRYRVDVIDSEGTRTLFTTEKVTVESPELALSQNYPNPFNPSTTIYYSIPERCHITLDIYDVSGRRIARLADGIQEAGTHHARWSGLNKNGSSVSSGVYFYKLTAGKNSITRKMVLMR